MTSRFPTKSKDQFYVALIYSLSLLVAGDRSVEASHAMQREVFIRASVVSLELTWVHHCKMRVSKLTSTLKGSKLMYDSYVKKGSKLTSNVQRFKVNVQRFKVTHAAWGQNLSASIHFHHVVRISINYRRGENSMNVAILKRAEETLNFKVLLW